VTLAMRESVPPRRFCLLCRSNYESKIIAE